MLLCRRRAVTISSLCCSVAGTERLQHGTSSGAAGEGRDGSDCASPAGGAGGWRRDDAAAAERCNCRAAAAAATAVNSVQRVRAAGSRDLDSHVASRRSSLPVPAQPPPQFLSPSLLLLPLPPPLTDAAAREANVALPQEDAFPFFIASHLPVSLPSRLALLSSQRNHRQTRRSSRFMLSCCK